MTDNAISPDFGPSLDCTGGCLRSSPANPGLLRDALAQFHRVWRNRQEQFRRYSPVSFWIPGMALTPEVRAAFERYLPMAEFGQDLMRLASLILPGPDWVPLLLRQSRLNPIHDGHLGILSSLPDFWNLLPQNFQARILYTENELLPLFCAIADLNRFGTAVNRYPEQQQQLRKWIRTRPQASWRLLDLGCGTGEGTYELAWLVHQESARPIHALGMTHEPLEAWMAATHRRPHHPGSNNPRPFRAPPFNLQFLAGDVLRLPVRAGGFDLIVANGLVGGPYLRQAMMLEVFYQELDLVLARNGIVAFANHFHEGCHADLDLVTAVARQRRWQTTGHRHDLYLTRQSDHF